MTKITKFNRDDRKQIEGWDKYRVSPYDEQYQEILDRHAAAEENFAKEMAENPEKKKSEQAEYGVK